MDIQSIFSDQKEMRLEINNKRKIHKLWKLSNTLLNNQWINEGIIRDTEKYFDANEITTY